MEKPKLLMMAAELPWPLDVGQKMVTYNDLGRLSADFEIDVVALVDRGEDDVQGLLDTLAHRLPSVRFHPIPHRVRAGASLLGKVPHVTRALATGRPYPVVKYANRTYLEAVSEITAKVKPQILYLDHLHASESSLSLVGANPGIPFVYRAHDAVYETVGSFAEQLGAFARPIGSVHSRQSRAYERRLWRRADLTFPVTRRLAGMIVAQDGDIADRVVYWPVPVELMPQRAPAPDGGARVLYVGTVRYPPNLEGLKWFVDQCWDEIRAAEPRAVFDVVGRGSEMLQDLDRGIVGHGYVSDIEPFYDATNVVIVPLFSGSGIRIKILDAFNRSRPVVSTTAGYAGLEVEDGRELLVADSASDFTAATLRVLGSPTLGSGLAIAGRTFLGDHHDPAASEAAVQRLLKLAGAPA